MSTPRRAYPTRQRKEDTALRKTASGAMENQNEEVNWKLARTLQADRIFTGLVIGPVTLFLASPQNNKRGRGMTPEEMLDQLAEYQAQRDALSLDQQAKIDAVITPEIKAQIDDIQGEYAPKYQAVDENISALTEQIKNEVIKAGATVKGSRLMAVYTKGRVSWDSKKLEGLMMVIPQVAEARKEGEPSVSIRKI